MRIDVFRIVVSGGSAGPFSALTGRGADRMLPALFTDWAAGSGDRKMDPEDRRSLDALTRGLDAVERKRNEGRRPPKGARRVSPGMALGMRISADLVAGVLVGVILGVFLDRTFATGPWFLIVLILSGAFAGGRNAYRAAKKARSLDVFAASSNQDARDGACRRAASDGS